MLELNPIRKLKWVVYEEMPGVRFEIRPLSDEEHNNIRKASKDKKSGDVDVVQFESKMANKIINDWEGVGDFKRENGEYVLDGNGDRIAEPVDCHDVAKLTFGKRYAYDVMPFLVEKAMEFNKELKATEEDAKNV